MVLQALPSGLFSILSCDFSNEIVAEDLHSFQITKEVINSFMKIRLLRYGQYFTEMTMKKGKSGIGLILGAWELAKMYLDFS